MFPLIPALILLLLHGHVPAERAWMPAVLDGVTWSSSTRPVEPGQPQEIKERAAQVCALLRLLGPRPPANKTPEPEAADVCVPLPQVRLADGFGKGRRTRDGPAVLS